MLQVASYLVTISNVIRALLRHMYALPKCGRAASQQDSLGEAPTGDHCVGAHDNFPTRSAVSPRHGTYGPHGLGLPTVSLHFLMTRPRTKIFSSMNSSISTAGSTPTAPHMRLRYTSPSLGFRVSWLLINMALSR